MEWTVHLANKKAAWYQYSELKGNLLYGEDNSYHKQKVALRNNKNENERQKLIIDPGPRTISGKRKIIELDENSVENEYPASFPAKDVEHGTPITSLGTLKTDSDGRLIVLGGYGHAGGSEPLTSYGGSDTWHDDISDGPVYCKITFNNDSEPVELQAWVIVGSPDFAPEIVNISTLSDTMFDVGVRHFNLVQDMYKDGEFNQEFKANYQRDILPIIQRFSRYQWVANVPSMTAFTSNIFDFSNPSDSNKNNRKKYFSYFREPNDKLNPSPDQPQEQLFKKNNGEEFPMMPLNSGSNSISNDNIEKFLSLNETQYFLLGQWAKGYFTNDSYVTPDPIYERDQASVGNCVGLPMSPGIEVTWSVQNPKIYSAPFIISDHKGKDGYNDTGLTPSRDECEGGGCEPGDLTKRMACPWQADFFQCTIQHINFSDPSINKDTKRSSIVSTTTDDWKDSEIHTKVTETIEVPPVNMPLPPAYYAYWWPPQSPWDVLAGELTLEGQEASHVIAGQQMNYARGINNFVQMVEHWSALAFIRDRNAADKSFPYFTETERNHELFSYKEVGVDTISDNPNDHETTIPVFFIEPDLKKVSQKSEKAKALCKAIEERAFKFIKIHDQGLGLPRSGTRTRR